MRVSGNSVQTACVAIAALWTTSPVLIYSTPFRALALLSVALWLALESLRPNGIFRKPTAQVLLVGVFIFYTAVVQILLDGLSSLTSHLQIWIMMFFLIVYQSRRNDMSSLVPVFWVVISTMPIWLIITGYTVTSLDAHAARVVVRSTEEAQSLAEQGVGGYALIYGTVLMLPGLMAMALARWRPIPGTLPIGLRNMPRLAPLLIWVNVVLGSLVVLTAGFTLAVIALMGVFVSLFALKHYSATRVFICVLVVTSLAIFAEPAVELLLRAMQPLADGTKYGAKVSDLLATLDSGSAVGTASDRVERYDRSINTFLENPLLGVLGLRGVGKHSEILDAFARWGVFFGIMYTYIVVASPVRMLFAKRSHFGAPIALIVGVLVIFGLNSSFAAAGAMMFIVFPVAMYLLARQDDDIHAQMTLSEGPPPDLAGLQRPV